MFTTPPQRLVIGIGNPLRGDDGVGAWLAHLAAGVIGKAQPRAVAVRSVQQLTPELAAELAALAAVLFIDAWHAPAGAAPQRRAVEAAADTHQSHRLTPGELLAISQLLYGRAPDAQLLRVPAYGFAHGTAFSAALRAVLPQAERLLVDWLKDHA